MLILCWHHLKPIGNPMVFLPLESQSLMKIKQTKLVIHAYEMKFQTMPLWPIIKMCRILTSALFHLIPTIPPKVVVLHSFWRWKSWAQVYENLEVIEQSFLPQLVWPAVLVFRSSREKGVLNLVVSFPPEDSEEYMDSLKQWWIYTSDNILNFTILYICLQDLVIS